MSQPSLFKLQKAKPLQSSLRKRVIDSYIGMYLGLMSRSHQDLR